MTEEWRPVVGFEGRYEVSDMGNVRSLRCGGGPLGGNGNPRKKPFPKKQYLMNAEGEWAKGYWAVGLCKDDHMVPYRVHKLVLEAFIGPCPPGCEASHKDGNSFHCRLANLTWETSWENHQRRREHGTSRVGPAKLAKLTPAIVLEARRRRHNHGVTYTILARDYGVTPSGIREAVVGRNWAHVD